MNKTDTSKNTQGNEVLADVSDSVSSLNEIQLEPVYASSYLEYSVIEQKLATLYRNQEKILQAIKLIDINRQ